MKIFLTVKNLEYLSIFEYFQAYLVKIYYLQLSLSQKHISLYIEQREDEVLGYNKNILKNI